MMNYAEKELREAMAYLDQARTTEETLKATLRLLELGEPVEVSFRSAKGTVATLCPTKHGTKLLDTLLAKAQARVRELEKQEVYWCEEVAHVEKQRKLDVQRREDAFDELRRTNPPEGVIPLAPHPDAPRA